MATIWQKTTWRKFFFLTLSRYSGSEADILIGKPNISKQGIIFIPTVPYISIIAEVTVLKAHLKA
jgi:hypothetical protein